MLHSISIQNDPGLDRATWELDCGVYALVGPNEAGKTALLGSLYFLRNALWRRVPDAIGYVGGNFGFRHLAAPIEEPVRFTVAVGDVEREPRPIESVPVAGSGVARRDANSIEFGYGGSTWRREDRLALRLISDVSSDLRLRAFAHSIQNTRYIRRLASPIHPRPLVQRWRHR
jgi:hypothetical protein